MKSNRRRFIMQAGAGTAALGVVSVLPNVHAAAPTPSSIKETDDPILLIGDKVAVADTVYGKVRGFILAGIYTFRGIPYGADTSGINRFMPPLKPAPWSEIKPALWWGNSAPQDMNKRFSNPYSSFIDHWNYDELSEDCLRINVWTPALKDGKKRPVIVWLHGGGFSAGNGIEQDGYHGENFSRRGDVVFCSLNHRLGAIGFSNFAGIDREKYAASGSAGMLDIVAALEWVRDNIANFGGDPGNVTIIGQSGGGAKVCTLAAMPSAKGLFHKAVALSGTSLRGIDQEYSEKLGATILKEAGINASEIDKLQKMPWREYLEIASRASRKMNQESPNPRMMRGGFSPVADGVILVKEPFFSDQTGLSADVPMMICTTFNEQSPSREDSSLEHVTLDQVKEKLKDRFKEKTSEIVDAYAKAFPDSKPVEIWSLVASNRQSAIATANAKSRQKAPVFLSWFGWQPPLFDNRMRAFHCSDICFWFYNTDRMMTHTGGGGRPRKLSAKMADSLVQFMRTGRPDGGGLPHWSNYTTANGETMVLNDTSIVKNDPDREARKALPVT
jgi:para-nitrobenzyl esterase